MKYKMKCETLMKKHEYEAKIMWMTIKNNMDRHVHVGNECYVIMYNVCLVQYRSRM